jgi:two-component system LytT family response regulator
MYLLSRILFLKVIALVKVLAENNYNIIGVAPTYNEALTLFYNNTIDIVVIDVFLDGKA